MSPAFDAAYFHFFIIIYYIASYVSIINEGVP